MRRNGFAPTFRSPARAGCAAPAGPGWCTARSPCGATTRSSSTSWTRDLSLAGKDKSRVQLVLLERVVAPHGDLAVHHPGPAGAAHPALAGERKVGANPLRRIQNRCVAG